MSQRAGHRSCNRLFEWIVAGAMFGVGVTALLIPANFPESNGLPYVALVVVGAIVAPAGAVRLSALWLNGTWAHSAKVRAAGAVVGGLMWFELLAALVIAGARGVVGPLELSVFVMLIAGEAITCYRAAIDDRTR